MVESLMKCPSCGHQFPLDEAVSKEKELEYTKRLETETERLRTKAKEWAAEEAERRVKLASREAQERSDVEKRIQAEELATIRKRDAEQRDQIVALMKSIQDLRDKEASREIENAKQLQEERRKLAIESEKRQATLIEEKLRQAHEDEQKRLAEKDQQMVILQKTIADLQRQATQGSQQAQGDALENALKEQLIRSFPFDLIEDVATGENGADLLQSVRNNLGHACGTMVWEVKNTKTWSEKWLGKLKDDRSRAKADVAILVTSVLPKNLRHFGEIEGLWITEPTYAPLVGSLLRSGLLTVAETRGAATGRETKMEALYLYLSSPQFKSHIETVMSAFQEMKNDIDSEKRAMNKHWAHREKSLERVLEGVTGMHGELKSLMGNALPNVASLELPDHLDSAT